MNAATSAGPQVERPSRAPVSLPEPSPRPPAILFGICALLFFAVLSFGAVEEWSVTVLEAGLALLFLAWAGRQVISGELKIQTSPLYAPAVLFAGIIAAQLAFAITAYRYATFTASLEYGAYGILILLTIQSLTGERSARFILWALTLFGFGLAVFAIAQDLTSNGKIYWLRTLHNGGSPFGPYVNHDHYAGLMEMLAPIAIVLSLGSLLAGGKRALVAFAGIVMAGTIVLSQSRAGTASFLAEMALLLGVALSQRKNGRTAAALGAVCALVLAFVAWLATAALWHHFTELQDWMRLAMTKDGLRMFWHKPVLGWGLGTFTTVYPQFRSFYTNLFVNAAHDDYVQVLAETGLIGFAAVVWFIVEVYRAGLRNLDGWKRDYSGALGLAAVVGCTGLLVHSFFDFNLQIPANACMFYFLCAIAATTRTLGRASLGHRRV
ncbi:MAG: O-antigen ligase family protein [Chlamydiota bacterium]